MKFNLKEISLLESYGFKVDKKEKNKAQNNFKYPECNKTVQVSIYKTSEQCFLRELTDAWNNPYPGIPDGYFLNLKDCLENSDNLKKFKKLSELKKFVFLSTCKI